MSDHPSEKLMSDEDAERCMFYRGDGSAIEERLRGLLDEYDSRARKAWGVTENRNDGCVSSGGFMHYRPVNTAGERPATLYIASPPKPARSAQERINEALKYMDPSWLPARILRGEE